MIARPRYEPQDTRIAYKRWCYSPITFDRGRDIMATLHTEPTTPGGADARVFIVRIGQRQC